MKTIETWLNEYGESHQNKLNKSIHWICVPLIFFSICGMLFSIKLPFNIAFDLPLNLGFIALMLVFFYYLMLSRRIALGMLLFSVGCIILCRWIEQQNLAPLWMICLLIFSAAWIGQFYGHHVEGKKPSFLKDIQFLLIGPAWLMSFIYKRFGIRL